VSIGKTAVGWWSDRSHYWWTQTGVRSTLVNHPSNTRT